LKETVKQLQICLQNGYAFGDLKNVRRISVLLMMAEQRCIEKINLVWNVSRQTISNWIKAWVFTPSTWRQLHLCEKSFS